MQILFFGKLADRIGRMVEIELAVARPTVADVRDALASRFPDARDELLKPSLRACVGDALVADDFALGDARLVEFFPPLSGG